MPSAIRTLTLLGLVLALLSLPLFAGMPNPLNNPLISEIHEASHALLFFGVGGILLQLFKWRTRWRPWLCVTCVVSICLVFGAAIEWVQPAFGRHRTWLDMERNALGVVAASGVFLALQSGLPAGRRAVAALLAAVALGWAGNQVYPWLKAQYQRNSQLPLIMDFDNPSLLPYIEAIAGADIRFINAPASWPEGRERAARIFMPGQAQWPGIRVLSPYPDWSNYQSLSFDAYYAGEADVVDIAVNVYTAQKGRKPWVYRQLSLQEGANRLTVELPSTSAEPASITDFLVYSKSKSRDLVIYLDNLRLEKTQRK